MGMCPDDSDSGTCETKPGGKCFAAVELVSDDDGAIVPQFTYGCLPPNEMALFQVSHFFCITYRVPKMLSQCP